MPRGNLYGIDGRMGMVDRFSDGLLTPTETARAADGGGPGSGSGRTEGVRYSPWSRRYGDSVSVVIVTRFGHGLPVIVANRVTVKAVTDHWE